MPEINQTKEKASLTEHYLEVLEKLIASKSIFAQAVGLAETAAYLKEVFEDAGAEVTVDESYAAPFILAQFKSSRPEAKHIIFYNHYDTQPADADQVWQSDPFQLTFRNGYMYGRGVDDDKGHITARLTAVVAYLKKHRDLPAHITFMMEGAEESASVDLEKYLAKYADKLTDADLLVWEQGIRNKENQIEISGGTKGIVTFNAEVKSAKVDSHSKFGAIFDSATWYLLNALSSLRAADGRILVDGIYEDIIQPSQHELDLVAEHAHIDLESLRELYDLSLPTLAKTQEDLKRRLFFEPALTIEGLSSGYLGQGVKTIIPAQASAKLEVRLVPGMDPHKVLGLIEKQLAKNGYNQVQLTYTLGEKGYRSDMTAPAIQNVINIAERFSQEGVAVLPTTAGTGPMHQVFEALQVPIVAFGIGNPDSRDHGSDENVKMTDYETHIKMIEELIASYD
ncbi:peptidase family M20 [Streptococcus agalactiae LMG 14747]|uniref:Peptidase family M20 n=2 Tax=Streptococcus TaxID=1301 RepID=V6Z4K7_STRAG|nr:MULTISPECIES: M20/M25/M40 family metallo-hydrolase [Streptococcus]ESV55668.1 peptidase family M20 [Streptococcus agalactiae LMG 14747]SNV35402.1 succinyl-diaminopimelate desuccinylase [Streptococcus acidominimus]